jgi:hypothetical protein
MRSSTQKSLVPPVVAGHASTSGIRASLRTTKQTAGMRSLVLRSEHHERIQFAQAPGRRKERDLLSLLRVPDLRFLKELVFLTGAYIGHAKRLAIWKDNGKNTPRRIAVLHRFDRDRYFVPRLEAPHAPASLNHVG